MTEMEELKRRIGKDRATQGHTYCQFATGPTRTSGRILKLKQRRQQKLPRYWLLTRSGTNRRTRYHGLVSREYGNLLRYPCIDTTTGEDCCPICGSSEGVTKISLHEHICEQPTFFALEGKGEKPRFQHPREEWSFNGHHPKERR